MLLLLSASVLMFLLLLLPAVCFSCVWPKLAPHAFLRDGYLNTSTRGRTRIVEHCKHNVQTSVWNHCFCRTQLGAQCWSLPCSGARGERTGHRQPRRATRDSSQPYTSVTGPSFRMTQARTRNPPMKPMQKTLWGSWGTKNPSANNVSAAVTTTNAGSATGATALKLLFKGKFRQSSARSISTPPTAVINAAIASLPLQSERSLLPWCSHWTFVTCQASRWRPLLPQFLVAKSVGLPWICSRSRQPQTWIPGRCTGSGSGGRKRPACCNLRIKKLSSLLVFGYWKPRLPRYFGLRKPSGVRLASGSAAKPIFELCAGSATWKPCANPRLKGQWTSGLKIRLSPRRKCFSQLWSCLLGLYIAQGARKGSTEEGQDRAPCMYCIAHAVNRQSSTACSIPEEKNAFTRLAAGGGVASKNRFSHVRLHEKLSGLAISSRSSRLLNLWTSQLSCSFCCFCQRFASAVLGPSLGRMPSNLKGC